MGYFSAFWSSSRWPNQPKPNTRTDPNEFLAGRSLLTLLMCSLFLQTSPAPMLTDRPRQPQDHQELTKPIPRLQNHPLQIPEHLSPNLPVSQKLPNFRLLVNKNIRLNTWKPTGKFPKSWKTFWWSEPQTFPESPGCPVMMLKFCAIQASNFSLYSTSSISSNTALTPLTPVGNPVK